MKEKKMRTVTEIETSVPAFLGKLWKLVEDPETDDLICWAVNGRSFFIRNPAQFARELLPHYYKHNNMASFVRQLNMYGFHKKVSVELGGLKCDRDEMEFAHQYFIKGHPYLLEHIKRKIASSKSQDSHPPMKSEMMNKVLTEVRTMRGRQEHLDSRLGAMKRENEALWRELAMLRRKHVKQQEIVNKLIHFLVTLVQPSRSSGLSVKRRYPLMIDTHRHKQSKMSKPEASPTGPVIHELHESDHDHDLDSQYIVAEMLENHQNPAIQSPESIDHCLDDDGVETVQYMEQSMNDDMDDSQNQGIAPRRKHFVKPKKKRKNKVPVKILIPPVGGEGEAREETLMVELSPEDDSTLPITLLEKNLKKETKFVPVKTVRSSKLAAMAANINKMNETDADLDDSEGIDSESKDDSDTVNLDDILSFPELDEDAGSSGTSNAALKSKQSQHIIGQDKQISSGQQQLVKGSAKVKQSAEINSPGSSSKSRDLSLSCVNPSGMSDTAYRLGPIEEMDSHVGKIENDLDTLRDLLRSEGYHFDTILGQLYNGEDPLSMGIPMIPELDPLYREKDGEENDANGSNATGGELMAYTPNSTLLDFDDNIFLGVTNSSPGGTASTTTECYSNDPLDLEDSKALLVDSLLSDNNANRSASS